MAAPGEQRRRAGDWNGAIVLFTKVWEKSGNLGVANNLAALLMQVDRLEEAEKILPRRCDRHRTIKICNKTSA